jgi:hypothetical protein
VTNRVDAAMHHVEAAPGDPVPDRASPDTDLHELCT